MYRLAIRSVVVAVLLLSAGCAQVYPAPAADLVAGEALFTPLPRIERLRILAINLEPGWTTTAIFASAESKLESASQNSAIYVHLLNSAGRNWQAMIRQSGVSAELEIVGVGGMAKVPPLVRALKHEEALVVIGLRDVGIERRGYGNPVRFEWGVRYRITADLYSGGHRAWTGTSKLFLTSYGNISKGTYWPQGTPLETSVAIVVQSFMKRIEADNLLGRQGSPSP